MRASWILKIVAVSIVTLFVAANGFCVEVSIGPEEVMLKTKEARKPAFFPHHVHQDMFSCNKCHHVNKGVMVIDDCDKCHNLDISNPDVNSFKKAAHKLCKDCHKAINKEEGREAPVKCSGCHPRKKE